MLRYERGRMKYRDKFGGLLAIVIASALLLAFRSYAVVPEHSVQNGTVKIEGVSAANPIIYDNDWWTDVPDAAYLWTKASWVRRSWSGTS